MVKLQSIILANARLIFCEEQIQLFTQMIQYIYALTCSIEPFSFLYIFFLKYHIPYINIGNKIVVFEYYLKHILIL